MTKLLIFFLIALIILISITYLYSSRISRPTAKDQDWMLLKRIVSERLIAQISPEALQDTTIATTGNKQSVILDGKEGKYYDGTGGLPIFSPDSQHLAYAAALGDKMTVVIDGQEGKRYDGVGTEVAGIIFDSSDSFHYIAAEDDNIYLVQESIR